MVTAVMQTQCILVVQDPVIVVVSYWQIPHLGVP